MDTPDSRAQHTLKHATNTELVSNRSCYREAISQNQNQNNVLKVNNQIKVEVALLGFMNYQKKEHENNK